MTKLDKPLSRAVSWDRGEFVVTLHPGTPTTNPFISIRPKHAKRNWSISLPWVWAQLCKKEASQ